MFRSLNKHLNNVFNSKPTRKKRGFRILKKNGSFSYYSSLKSAKSNLKREEQLHKLNSYNNWIYFMSISRTGHKNYKNWRYN